MSHANVHGLAAFFLPPPHKTPSLLYPSHKYNMAFSLAVLPNRAPLQDTCWRVSQKAQLRANLAGVIRTCARMWARGRLVTGLCPACGYEKTKTWLISGGECRAEQYAPIREKGSPNVNIEEMHPAHRDMSLVLHDAQLLEWARHDRTDEVAAVSAADDIRKNM